uniref:Uncharacterized protein n=1 Tax=Amorphochlora amoebiformis TaxID=1561963 RepID=A0A7S0DUN4_9EUKA|mmetsp:Transcript_7492/g.11595  ORF Transcript_7492/g.11595 Transcript_7492/m.11595 type:complete len:296 (+) Transcript_7492:20-907(+)
MGANQVTCCGGREHLRRRPAPQGIEPVVEFPFQGSATTNEGKSPNTDIRLGVEVSTSKSLAVDEENNVPISDLNKIASRPPPPELQSHYTASQAPEPRKKLSVRTSDDVQIPGQLSPPHDFQKAKVAKVNSDKTPKSFFSGELEGDDFACADFPDLNRNISDINSGSATAVSEDFSTQREYRTRSSKKNSTGSYLSPSNKMRDSEGTGSDNILTLPSNIFDREDKKGHRKTACTPPVMGLVTDWQRSSHYNMSRNVISPSSSAKAKSALNGLNLKFLNSSGDKSNKSVRNPKSKP